MSKKLRAALVFAACGAMFGLSHISCASDPKHRKGFPMHHTDSGFRNYPIAPTSAPKGFRFYIRRVMGSVFTATAPEDHSLSEEEALLQYRKLEERDSVTWLGHSTFLLKAGGRVILTDPYLTTWASPTPVGGPRRYVPPGISIKNLPRIDIIIVSHDHYDHLDSDTIEKLPGKEETYVLAPLGLGSFFKERGYKNVKELDWDQSFDVEGLKITALPAMHDSGRKLGKLNSALWCSWAIEHDGRKFYYGGDTAYSKTIFKKIGEDFISFDLAIVPIGGYEPREVMWMSHVNPEEAVQIGLDTKAANIVAGHWGTIDLSDEPILEPPRRFMKAALKNGFDEDRAWLMKIGETRVVP